MADFKKALEFVLSHEGALTTGLADSTVAEQDQPLLCSRCFNDQGLSLDANRIGIRENSLCKNCGATNGAKLTKSLVMALAHRFFVKGTIHRTPFGAAPIIQFNDQQSTSIRPAPWFAADLKLIEGAIGVGFFRYGPCLWMVGEVEPLKALELPEERAAIIKRILTEYPERLLSENDRFYRLRSNPRDPSSPSEYDSAPESDASRGRLDSKGFPVLYASQDLQICVHECRVTVEDEAFVSTLEPARNLRFLDLTHLLEEDVTEFESLDIAVHMVFLAGSHAYHISRAIAVAAREAGYDGIIYPSYFSLLRTGGTPFDTIYGISVRKIPEFGDYAKAQIIPNIAVFGRPIEEQLLRIRGINKIVLNRAEYELLFGPVGFD